MAMENNNTNNNYAYTPQYGYGQQQPYYGTPWNNGYGAAPMMYNNWPGNVNFTSSLSDAEAQTIRENREAFNLNVDEKDVIKAMCNHKHPHHDPVHPANDGSGDLICDICGTRWNPTPVSKEEVTAAINTLINFMEVSKYMGELPIEAIRDYYPIIPMLRKFPDIYELAVNNFNKYYNNSSFSPADEVSGRYAYNQLVGGYNPAMYYPGQAPMNNGYYQQQPANNGYYQQPMNNTGFYQPPMNNPAVNPMQTPYGVNNVAPNQQFNNQANTMMNGGAVYQQPNGYYQQQPMNNGTGFYQPPVNNPQGNVVNNGVPAYAPQQQPVNNNNSAAATTADNAGTVTKEKKLVL